jgi:2',3'-cyclic-nucleotide 2'-phosphodiesterase (5'-nucleotidase family)
MKSMRKYYFLTLLIGCVFFSCQKKYTYYAYEKSITHRFDSKIIAEDTALVRLIKPYKTTLDGTMNEVLGHAEVEMIKEKPYSTLTNWFCDAIKDGYKIKTGKEVDFVFQNYGGIRLNAVSEGNITLSKVYELMPFENAFVVMKIDGKVLSEVFDKIAKSGGWPISEGVSMAIKDSTAIDILIQGKPFDKNKTYTVGTSDYVANGGDAFYMLKNLAKEEEGLLIRDLIVAHIRKMNHVMPNGEARIKLIK